MELVIITIGYCISLVITIGLGFVVLFSAAKQETRISFFLMAVAISIFELSFVLGVNTARSDIAYRIFFFNLADIFIVIFNTHWILSVLGKVQDQKRNLYCVYGAGILLVLFYLVFPDTFLTMPVPKMYFKNYYEGGNLYILMIGYFVAVFVYVYYFLIREYFRSDRATRNRLKYFIASLTFGYGLGSTAFPLVLNVRVDPILSMLTGFYTIPLAYGILKHQIMDIRLIIKKALIYSVAIALLSGGMMAIAFLSEFFMQRIPGFRFWFIPFIAGITAFIVGKLFWDKSKEADRLKYEFITVAAHKLRTPLTHIKWVADALLQRVHTDDEKRLIQEIYKADNRLVELADILLGTAKEEGGSYVYHQEDFALDEVVRAVCDELKYEIEKKQLHISLSFPEHIPHVHGDMRRIRSVVRIFLENAVLYTPVGGTITATIHVRGGHMIFSVQDTGIGISREDQQFIFEKFFRTHKASITDTEGSGLGLFIGKSIIERHGGSMGVQSEGEGKGSRFWFSLPV